MNWFRFYSEVVHDPKVQNLPEVLFKTWVNLLCLACLNDGNLPSIADISYHLRITENRASKAVKALVDAGLVDAEGQTLQPHNWRGRQFSSDHSRNRVAAFRERNRNTGRNVTEPLPKLKRNAIEQNRADTEQNRTEAAMPNFDFPSWIQTLRAMHPGPKGTEGSCRVNAQLVLQDAADIPAMAERIAGNHVLWVESWKGTETKYIPALPNWFVRLDAGGRSFPCLESPPESTDQIATKRIVEELCRRAKTL
jgi:hypothetical protein